MARLFLIRRNLEHYIGPMTVPELVAAYKRMEFGLQDEIAGHCGQWVAFDNMDAMREFYPDLARVVAEDMLGGWGMSTHAGEEEIVPRQKKKKKRSASAPPKKKTAGLSSFVWGVAIAGVLSVGALLSIYAQPTLLKLLVAQGDYSTEEAQKLLLANNFAAFDAYMTPALQEIAPRMNKSMRLYREWIPYVRAYAYQRDGVVDGFNAKMLRGLAPVNAPLDCSVASLRDKWLSENVGDVMDGKALPKGEVTRLLFADPHWIRRRRDPAGWIVPRNYYEACLSMALQAWRSEPVLGLREQQPLVEPRLLAILAMTRGEAVAAENVALNLPLSVVQCYDRSMTLAQVDACAPVDVELGIWRDGLEFRRRQTQLRILWSQGNVLSDADKSLLSRASASVVAQDDLSRLDYAAELKLARTILLNGGKIDDAINKMRLETLDVEFRPQ